MEENLKQLLLKDLCARLPHNMWVQYEEEKWLVTGYGHGRVLLLPSIFSSVAGPCPLIEDIKPYFRPMSFMTEEERREYDKLIAKCIYDPEAYFFENYNRLYDWLNAHYFDYRGLIPMGLALEATEEMYKDE